MDALKACASFESQPECRLIPYIKYLDFHLCLSSLPELHVVGSAMCV